jgi:hypothetical protein
MCFLRVTIQHQEPLTYAGGNPILRMIVAPADTATHALIPSDRLYLEVSGQSTFDFVYTALHCGVMKMSSGLDEFYEFTPIFLEFTIDNAERLLREHRDSIPGLVIDLMLSEIVNLRQAGIRTIRVDLDQSISDWHRAIFGAAREHRIDDIIDHLTRLEQARVARRLESLHLLDVQRALQGQPRQLSRGDTPEMRRRAEQLRRAGVRTIFGNLHYLADALTVAERASEQCASPDPNEAATIQIASSESYAEVAG